MDKSDISLALVTSNCRRLGGNPAGARKLSLKELSSEWKSKVPAKTAILPTDGGVDRTTVVHILRVVGVLEEIGEYSPGGVTSKIGFTKSRGSSDGRGSMVKA
jgi:hypothetical protein